MVALWWRTVRFGFRLLYNEFAFTYDSVSWIVSRGAWGSWIQSALIPLQPRHGLTDGWILELAHGTGRLQAVLVKENLRAVGYDLSPAMGRIAGRRLRANGVEPRLVRGMAQRLPFADGAFNAILVTFPTDFIIAPETLREVARVLAHDGQFIIVPHAYFVANGLTEQLLKFAYRVTGQRGRDDDEAQMNVETLTQRWRSFLSPYGFEVSVILNECPRSRAVVVTAQRNGQ